MNLDFPTILVLATFLTGAIWAIDAWFFAPKRKRKLKLAAASASGDIDPATAKHLEKEPLLVEISRSFFPVILIVLLLRSFLIEPFRIPSGSMMPTLLDGDFILVNKFAYGIRLPAVNTKVLDIGEPQRGDVAVFRYPENPTIDFIKRIVGLPGDTIRYRDQTLYINGEKMPQQIIGEYFGDVSPNPYIRSAQQREEDLKVRKHDILISPDHPAGGRYGVIKDYVVPEGSYFVLGDNRDNSKDSRFWGELPQENLVGKAFMIWMHWDWGADNGPIGWNRIGNSID